METEIFLRGLRSYGHVMSPHSRSAKLGGGRTFLSLTSFYETVEGLDLLEVIGESKSSAELLRVGSRNNISKPSRKVEDGQKARKKAKTFTR